MSDCSFTQHSMCFEYPLMWRTYSTIWLLPGWYCVKMLSSQRMFCVHHTAMYQFTVSFYSKRHTLSVCDVCLAVTCYLHFWHKDQNLVHAAVVKFTHCSCWDSNSVTF